MPEDKNRRQANVTDVSQVTACVVRARTRAVVEIDLYFVHTRMLKSTVWYLVDNKVRIRPVVKVDHCSIACGHHPAARVRDYGVTGKTRVIYVWLCLDTWQVADQRGRAH